nr:Na/Pi symporter [Nitrosococcus wardiae]
MNKIEFILITLGFLTGIASFIYGVTLTSRGLRAVGSARMKNILATSTRNAFMGVLTGALATVVLESSSVTIIMVIALVNAGLLTFEQSLGVILGANIGTTIGTEIIALDITTYLAIPMLLIGGLILRAKKTRIRQVGISLLGMGLIFFGLAVMSGSLNPLRDYPPLIESLSKLEDPFWGVLSGGLVTLMIQSSSATLGIIISLADQGLITLSGAVAAILGAEIATCSDTLLATIGRSREAVRAGIFHLFFNISTVTLGILFFFPFLELVEWISLDASLPRQVANAQVLFNLLGVLLFIQFIPLIAKIINTVIPNKYGL